MSIKSHISAFYRCLCGLFSQLLCEMQERAWVNWIGINIASGNKLVCSRINVAVTFHALVNV